jgi:hypothetical protein
LILHGSHHATEVQLLAHGLEYRARLSAFLERGQAGTLSSAGARA